MPPARNITGQRFGKLLALSSRHERRNGRSNIVWECACDCGGRCRVSTHPLLVGHTRSCGCREGNHSHGHTSLRSATGARRKSSTYLSWAAAKRRCYRPNFHQYKDYGGRGITMCPRWLTSFENFLADMGERPSGKTLDRFPDNNGNYEPGNCRWATRKEQQANRRKSTINSLGLNQPEMR